MFSMLPLTESVVTVGTDCNSPGVISGPRSNGATKAETTLVAM